MNELLPNGTIRVWYSVGSEDTAHTQAPRDILPSDEGYMDYAFMFSEEDKLTARKFRETYLATQSR